MPDWNDLKDYTEKQSQMHAFDQLMAYAEEKEFYAIIFRHHVEVNGADWDLPNWKNNPYRKEFNLQKPSDYFTDIALRQDQRNSLRYQFARWGYSPYFAFYGYSEVDNWIQPMVDEEGLSEAEAAAIFSTWFQEQQEYMRELNPDMLYVNSYAGVPNHERNNPNGLLAASDILALHAYGETKGVNYDYRARESEIYYQEFKRPVLIEEMGVSPDKLTLYCCTSAEFHNAIWCTTFMGGMGTGMEWWWNRGIHDFDFIRELELVMRHTKGIDFAAGAFKPQRYSDGTEKERTIESYCLIGDSKNTAIGWVKNSTVYWRNLTERYDCMKQLVETGTLDYECVSEDGYHKFHEQTSDYSVEKYRDEYTDVESIQRSEIETIGAEIQELKLMK